jgi:hypothetical protein
VTGELIPSLHERERYCRSDEKFADCPTWRLFQRERRRLAQAEYYALWTPPVFPELRPVVPLRKADPIPSEAPQARAV